MSTPPPRYTARLIADELRAAINRGDYKPGHQLPTGRALRERYGVAAQTTQNAFDLLRAEGLVVGLGGGGVFVREPEAIVRIPRRRFVFRDRISYYFDETAQGYRLIGTPTVEVVPAPVEMARRLGIEPGSEVVKRTRVVGEPEPEPRGRQRAVSYLPAWLRDELPVIGEANTGLGGIYDRIEEHYGEPLVWEEAQGAVAAGVDEAEALDGVVHGGPLVRILRTASLPDGRAVEVNDTRMDGARYEVVAVLERDESASWPPAPATEAVTPPAE
ncbi:GntR family transcriptional regulator [Lentzea cavernae]|uniref:GntR family transcriptional regulator n=1 Tax=Lentzea cavernae TaxID=2020703 RepID=A0ABQ3MX59_9PSEU|nr:GntR family transcriptional regulator [Lentzea cavernae]GHH57652.1 GntR family transcriptional regulator [Lentzea cavernae]